ncbi:MAG: pilus assembly FimT family protein [Myxococcota bacterium]
MSYLRPRGFTLLEMMVTLGILAVLMVISINGLSLMRPRADLSTSVADISRALTNARQLALAHGSSVWFGFIPPGDQGVGYYIVYESWDGSFDPATSASLATVADGDDLTKTKRAALHNEAADEEQCADARCHRDHVRSIEALPPSIEPAAGSVFGDDDHLPVSFRYENLSSLDSGCSFCTSEGPGWLEFLPRGEVRFPAAPDDPNAVLVLSVRDEIDQARRAHLISITAPYGLVRRFAND